MEFPALIDLKNWSDPCTFQLLSTFAPNPLMAAVVFFEKQLFVCISGRDHAKQEKNPKQTIALDFPPE